MVLLVEISEYYDLRILRNRPMNPEAVYTDCFAHRLNLSLVNTMRGAGKVSEVLELLSVLCTFLSDSNVHIEFQCDERQPISLKNHTIPRCPSRYESCNAVFRTLPAIYNTLTFYASVCQQ